MNKNVGAHEANIRTGIAAALIISTFFFVENPYIRIIIAIIAAILASTAFLRTCPINALMHRNTNTDTTPAATVPPTPDSTATPDSGTHEPEDPTL